MFFAGYLLIPARSVCCVSIQVLAGSGPGKQEAVSQSSEHVSACCYRAATRSTGFNDNEFRLRVRCAPYSKPAEQDGTKTAAATTNQNNNQLSSEYSARETHLVRRPMVAFSPPAAVGPIVNR